MKAKELIEELKDFEPLNPRNNVYIEVCIGGIRISLQVCSIFIDHNDELCIEAVHEDMDDSINASDKASVLSMIEEAIKGGKKIRLSRLKTSVMVEINEKLIRFSIKETSFSGNDFYIQTGEWL